MRKFTFITGIIVCVALIAISFSFTKPTRETLTKTKYHKMMSSGGLTGVAASGCFCHGGVNSSVGISLAGLPASPIVGVTYPLTLTITGTKPRAGFNLSATEGTFSNPGAFVQLSNSEITHTQPTALSGGTVSFNFDWTPAASGNTTFNYAVNNVDFTGGTGGDDWNIGSVEIPVQTLPVKLTYFKGHNVSNNMNQLIWKSEQEINFSKYELEYSCNSIDFSHVTTMLPQRNNQFTKTYSYQHYATNCYSSKTYYRLKMINLDGTYEYSPIININKQDGETSAFIFPNPVRANQQSFNVYTGKTAVAQIQLINQEGKAVQTYAGNSNLIEVELAIPAGIQSGNYVVRIQYKNGTSKTMSLLVQ